VTGNPQADPCQSIVGGAGPACDTFVPGFQIVQVAWNFYFRVIASTYTDLKSLGYPFGDINENRCVFRMALLGWLSSK
jgi:hypothetical protein